MAPKLYFIGNVFNRDDEVAKYDDRGFAFSDGEKRELDLVGLPIQLEHNDKLSVGHVRQSWYEDGQRWVLGDVDREGLDGYFAANAVKSKLYTGLSLQHISYQLEDGTQMKVPVEVSLCEDPRRPDCRVHHHTASARDPYFRLSKRLKQMTDATPTPTLEVATETTAPVALVETPEETTHVAAAETKERTQDELYQLLVDQQKEIDAMRGNLTSAQTKVQEFEAQKAAVHKAQAEKAQEKLQSISKSLLEWCAANEFELTDARVEKLAQLAKDHPATAETLFEIAHCASNKHKETVMQLAEQQKQTQTAVLQEKVEGVFEKRQNAAGPVTHTAAAPKPAVNRFTQHKRKQSPSEAYGMTPNSDLIEALKKQRNSYSGRGSMMELYRDLQKQI